MNSDATEIPQDLIVTYRRKVAHSAKAWLDFAVTHRHDFATLEKELDNLSKSIYYSGLEPGAVRTGLQLVQVLWPYVEFRGHWLAWERTLEKSLSLGRSANLREDEANVLIQLGELCRLVGKTDQALKLLLAAMSILEELNDLSGVARVRGLLSQLHLAFGDSSLAQACCQQAADVFDRLGDTKELATVHNNWGIVDAERGDLAGALGHFVEADTLFRRIGKLRGQAKAVANIGRVFQIEARQADALAAYGQAVELYQLVGDELNSARMQVNLATLWHEEGRTAEALAATAELEAVFHRVGDRAWLARVVNNQGVYHQALGRPAEALGFYQAAARLYLDASYQWYGCSALVNCADALLDQSRTVEAAAILAQVRGLLASSGPPPEWLLHDVDAQAARLRAMAEQ